MLIEPSGVLALAEYHTCLDMNIYFVDEAGMQVCAVEYVGLVKQK